MTEPLEEAEDRAAGGKTGNAEKKKRDRQTYILIVLGALGLLVAFLTFRKSSSATTTGAAGGTSSASDLSNYPATTAGYVAGDDGSSAANGLATLIENLQSQIAQSGLTTQTTGSTTSTTSGTTAKPTPYFDYAGAKTDNYLQSSTGIEQVDPAGGADPGGIFTLSSAQWAEVQAANGGKAPPVTKYKS